MLTRDLFYPILAYLDTATLIRQKAVCKEWQDVCSAVIAFKSPTPRKAFSTNKELRKAVRKYMKSTVQPEYAEEIASTYGWPIGQWDVSNVTDMSHVFHYYISFNEDIGNWDVSNVTDMSHMFYNAVSFNRDIGLWNVSNVTCMHAMF